MKKWLTSENTAVVKEIYDEFGEFIGKLLLGRGINTLDKARDFFGRDSLSDPFEMADMQAAVDVITDALDEGKQIVIFGDYDCDGVTSTAMLYSYLEAMGSEVEYYIPARSEGYGMNMDAVKRIIDNGAELIITVDNGISAFAEAEYIRSRGVQLVITDHHQISDGIPVCDACVNPHRPDDRSEFKELCGAGVVLKLLCALEDDQDFVIEQYAELAAIGTIADVVSLTGENRYIVRRGLECIRNSQNIGVDMLLRSAKCEPESITATNVAYVISPRINAAGRIDHANKAVQLLLADNHETASALAEELELYNTSRKDTEAQILAQAVQQIESDPLLAKQRVLIVDGMGWHHGVVGIVCSRLLERYGKPVFVISVEPNGEARGSARGIDGFSIYNLLVGCSDVLIKYGGHPKAGGFSLEARRINEFRQRAYEYCRMHYPKMPDYYVYADMETSARQLTLDNVQLLERLEPFGEGNQKPVFLLKNCILRSKNALSGGKYTGFEIENNGVRMRGQAFGIPFDSFRPQVGSTVDMIVSAVVNEYNGNTSVNLRVKEIRPSDFAEDRFCAAQRVYEEICRGEGCDSRLLVRIIPDREQLKQIYDLIRTNGDMSAEEMCLYQSGINYCMLRITLDAFAQAGMIQLSSDGQSAKLIPTKEKKDLYAEGILAELKAMAK